MLKQAMMMAAISVVSLTSAFVRTENFELREDGTPAPGAFQVFLNVPSVSSLMADIGAFVPYYTVIGKEFDINLDWKSSLVEVAINNATITNVMIADSHLSFVNNTDKLIAQISKADIDLAINATAKLPLGITIDLVNITLKNVTIQLEMQTTTSDQVHWQLHVEPFFGVSDVIVGCKQKMWQHAIDELKPEFMKVGRYAFDFAEGVLKGAVDALNYDLAHQTDDMFVFDIKGLPLNLTMTRYPEFNNVTQEIILHMDGLFVQEGMSENVPVNTEWQNYTGHVQREQIWLHESMLDSLIYSLKKRFTHDNTKMQKQLFMLIPEVYYHYGSSYETVDCDADISFPYQMPVSPFSVDKSKGLIIGDETTGLVADIKLHCASMDAETGELAAEKELALDLQLGLHMVANFTWTNFQYWIELDDVKCVAANATSPVVELEYHDWVDEFTYLIKGMTDSFNLRFSTPVDLKTKTLVMFVAGLVPNTILSPFEADDFLLAGFSMITDPKTPMAARAAQAVNAFLQ